MTTPIPSTHTDLFTKKAFANLATVNADGTLQVTPVWIDWDGKNLLVNTAQGRLKDRNMRRNPHVAISIMDPDNPYRYLAVQGRVSHVTTNGADAHIDKMAKKYMGKDSYPFRTPTEVRVVFTIEPDKVHTNG